ncbi:uncharacterized protein LODBEIA_P30150 [Lodderomyces beijingensis]|uniref:Ribosomal RNA-processing protein 40 n=1 Tax=Lodderomyces beijingensis TaxID=1775926 RepID=A0ABP0ZPG0_9ASCO
MSSIILPGDSLPSDSNVTSTKIGPGIYKYPRTQTLIPSAAGILQSPNPDLIYIESNTKRYVPRAHDYVVGTIVGSIGEYYKVQLQSFSPPVMLPFLGFANATKKNRPNLKVGQVVYARVVSSDEVECEVVCYDAGNARDAGGFGVLDESGLVVDVELNFARELLYNASSEVLALLSRKVQFEVAVGINGRVWIKCGDGVGGGGEQGDKVGEGEDGEEQGESDRGRSLKNLKDTLAAVRYLKMCQSRQPSEFESALKDAFKGV